MERLIFETPFGRSLLVVHDGEHIVESSFCAARPARRPRTTLGREIAAQVRAYLQRRVQRFDLPLLMEGSALHVAAWRAATALRFGETASYAEIAAAIGRPGAHRAVASAMARTPLDLFLPAHRVIGADGSIRGASPDSMRRILLAFEGITVPACSHSQRIRRISTTTPEP